MHLTRMRVGGIPPFIRPVEFKFHERVNVFVGPNASGKSTLLAMLADRFIGPESNSKRPIFPNVQLTFWREEDFDESDAEWLRHGPSVNILSTSEDRFAIGYEPIADPPVVHIGPVREELPGISNQESSDAFGETAAEALDGAFQRFPYNVRLQIVGGGTVEY